MTRDEQDVILDLFPDAVSWSNIASNGLFRYPVYGVFVPNDSVNDVIELLDSSVEVEDFGFSMLIR